jgi:hypothetical protein
MSTSILILERKSRRKDALFGRGLVHKLARGQADIIGGFSADAM